MQMSWLFFVTFSFRSASFVFSQPTSRSNSRLTFPAWLCWLLSSRRTFTRNRFLISILFAHNRDRFLRLPSPFLSIFRLADYLLFFFFFLALRFDSFQFRGSHSPILLYLHCRLRTAAVAHLACMPAKFAASICFLRSLRPRCHARSWFRVEHFAILKIKCFFVSLSFRPSVYLSLCPKSTRLLQYGTVLTPRLANHRANQHDLVSSNIHFPLIIIIPIFCWYFSNHLIQICRFILIV